MQEVKFTPPPNNLSSVEAGLILNRFGSIAEENDPFLDKVSKRNETPPPGSAAQKAGFRRHRRGLIRNRLMGGLDSTLMITTRSMP